MESLKCSGRPPGRGRAQGFTLIETLIALAIAAILSAVLTMIALPGDAARAQDEARRLAALLELASTEARTTGQRLAWSPEETGYAFWQLGDDGEWTRFPETSIFRPRSFAGEIVLRAVRVNSRDLPAGSRVSFSAYGDQALIEATVAGGNARFVLRGGILGRISLRREADDDRASTQARLHAG